MDLHHADGSDMDDSLYASDRSELEIDDSYDVYDDEDDDDEDEEDEEDDEDDDFDDDLDDDYGGLMSDDEEDD